MSDSPVLNPGVGPNEIASPNNLHTEPPFQRPVYEGEVEEPEEPKEAPKEVSQDKPKKGLFKKK